MAIIINYNMKAFVLMLLLSQFITCQGEKAELLSPSRSFPFEIAFATQIFQKCTSCRCCDGGNCKVVPNCCHELRCNPPGKPYGTCSFTPIACNCNGCGST
ncbi:hypothetical protein ACFE04_009726 [Oxalis oulophora]